MWAMGKNNSISDSSVPGGHALRTKNGDFNVPRDNNHGTGEQPGK
jgi:hypothetical protein